MREIISIFVDGCGHINREPSRWEAEPVPIKEIKKNGEMAEVIWYRRGNTEYNGKYVIKVEYAE